jgi:Tol biopolymer transport system component
MSEQFKRPDYPVFQVIVRDRATGQMSVASRSNAGSPGNDTSQGVLVSGDGRHVVFESKASNLVPGDSNRRFDVFVRDLDLHRTVRVSVSSSGTQANGGSLLPSISANGRFVTFTSDATNLVKGDNNGFNDVFIHDLKTGITSLVSQTPDGTPGNGSSDGGRISDDGSFVFFDSRATDLIAGDTNGKQDAFVRDLQRHVTTRVSVTDAGGQLDQDSSSGGITPDGDIVAFSTSALVTNDRCAFREDRARGYLRTLASGATRLIGGCDAGGDDGWLAGPLSDQARTIAGTASVMGMFTYATIFRDGEQVPPRIGAFGESEATTTTDDGRYVGVSNEQPDNPSGALIYDVITRTYRVAWEA